MNKLQEVYMAKFKAQGEKIDRWYINTDGASSHFKSKETMYSLKIFLKKSGAVSVMWKTALLAMERVLGME